MAEFSEKLDTTIGWAKTKSLILSLLKKHSKNDNNCYVVCSVTFGNLYISTFNSKPQNPDDVEYCYNLFGGIIKGDKIVRPSPSCMKKINHYPILN